MKDNRIKDILHILSEYEKGNFNVPLPFHDGSDDISAIIGKLSTLRESLERTADRFQNDEYRLNQILDAIVRITTFDFSEKIPLSNKHDAFDGIALGLNLLSHELENRINELAQKNDELLNLTAVIETTADAVTTITPTGVLTSWNKSAERIYGYSANEMIGKKPEDILMVPSEVNNFREALNRVREGEQIYSFQTKRIRKDGIVIDVALSLTPIISQGRLVSISVISRDITTEIAAGKMLKESEERYRLLVQRIRNYAIITMDPDGFIVSVNAGAFEVTGYTEAEILGQHISIFYTQPAQEKNHPQLHMQFALERGRYHHIGWKVKKGQQKIWAETVCAPFFDEAGNLKGFSKVMQDITERKITENMMKEHQEQIETIIGNAPSAVVVANEKNLIVKWNAKAEEIFGWKADEVLNHPIQRLLTVKNEESAESERRLFYTLEEAVNNKSVETLAQRKNGEIFPVELGVSAVKSRRKTLFIAFITDITNRKKAEAEIRNANEALDASNKDLEAFTYSVSHDLRAPIRAIQGYTDLLFHDLKGNITVHQEMMMKNIVKNTKKMAQLINDLLALSHLGQKELEREHVNMNKIVQTVIEGITSGNEKTGTEFKIGRLPDSYADYNLMIQVFHNLISNAVKYSSRSKNPIVEVGVIKQDERNVYYVKDNGAGFDMKYYDKLFAVFQRLHSTQEYEGTGVGLSIVKRIIDKHHGKIWAESEPGRGATFYFFLEDEKTIQ